MKTIETMINKWDLYRALSTALKIMEDKPQFISEVVKIEKRLLEIGISAKEIERFEIGGLKAICK